MAVQRQREVSGFGTLLRRHRTAAGLSQEALAERAGLSTRAISDLERGVKKRPHPATMRLLADALELGPEERATLAAASRPADTTSTPPPEPNGLPLPGSPIVGRASELASAIEMIRSGATRLLTLTGPGGVGKTRLSLEIARNVASDFAQGAVFVELAPIADPALVVPTVAAALNLREASEQPLAETIRDFVRSRRMLLVLDNCEHLLDEACALVADLIEHSSGLTILVTSRPPLRVRGEQVVPLAPMALANPDRVEHVADLAGVPAIDLFVQRATSVRPDFALTDANARDVAAICARLDGLPLAIELAAIRIRTLSPATLVGLLSERLRLLTSGPRDAPARQQTLRAAIEWSHNLLDAKQQQCFRRLAVFAGGCTLESVTAITDDDDPFAALDALEALVDQGLALRSNDTDSDPRFRMLETVREYALERLHASGDADSIRAAQAHYLVALAERAGPQLHGPAPGRWLDLLDTEQDNFRAALAWSLGDTGDTGNASMALSLTAALWPFWHMRGHLQEGQSWLERAVAGGDQVDPAIRAGAFLDLANVANNLEDHSRARDLYEESLRLCQELGNRSGVAGALVGLGMVATSQGFYDHAEDHLRQGLAVYQETSPPEATLPCIYALGRLAMAKGHFDEAENRFREARALCHPEDVGSQSYLSLEIAQLERYLGNVEIATQLAEECLARFREIGERRAEASSLAELGYLSALQGDPHRAVECVRDAAALHLDPRDELGVAACLEGLATIAVERDQPRLAATIGSAANSWRSRTGTVRGVPERAAFDATVATIRATVGASTFEAAWEAGTRMSLDQALDATTRLVTT